MNNITELWEAIEEGDEWEVRRLLSEHPQFVEATGECGESPLMHAAACDCRTVPVIQAILEFGADVNLQTPGGSTALHYSIGVNGENNYNSGEVIGALVAAGADLKLRQHYGWTPLLEAVIEGTEAQVTALLAAGADPNETMPTHTLPAFNAGRTALMASIFEPDYIEPLLRAGADPLVRDGNGMTFFDYVESLERKYEGSEFAAKMRRCADIARNWAMSDRTQPNTAEDRSNRGT